MTDPRRKLDFLKISLQIYIYVQRWENNNCITMKTDFVKNLSSVTQRGYI